MKRVLLLVVIPLISKSQIATPNFDNIVHGLTTIIKTEYSSSLNHQSQVKQGTGFFYNQYIDTNKISLSNPLDSNLKRIWLVTNRHVAFPVNSFHTNAPTPDVLEFYLRKKHPRSKLPTWDTIRLSSSDIRLRTRVHPDNKVDVATIDVTDLILNKLQNTSEQYFFSAVSKRNFPSDSLSTYYQFYEPGVGSEIMSIGYPKGFYDELNLFPTVKYGIVSSKWGSNFNGLPIFLIDSKLFPGSSGSIIISKPTLLNTGNSDIYKYFLFFGVYSGEPYKLTQQIDFEEMSIIKRDNYNLGIVWYYNLIDSITK